jgi:thioredoxin reductase (NADPH)
MTPYTVKEFVAGVKGPLAHAVLVNVETGEEHELTVTGTFIAIGHEPQSELVRGQVELDDAGYVITEGKSTRTNRPGVFAAGDLVDHTYRQAVTAAGSGTQAALDAEWYLRDTPGIPVPAKMPVGDPAEAQWAPAATSAEDSARGVASA